SGRTAHLHLLAREHSHPASSARALQSGDAVEPAPGCRNFGARCISHGVRLCARVDLSRRGEGDLGVVGSRTRPTSDDHAGWAAWAAATIGAGADLFGIAVAVAAGRDGIWL